MIRANIEAFVLEDDTQQAVESAFADRRLAKSKTKLEPGGISAAIEHYQSNATPALIVLESESNTDQLLNQIDQLAETCDAGTQVMVIGQANDIALYRDLINRGVSDYLVKPIAPRQVIETISGILLDPDAPPMGRLIAFVGSRGGAGSSTVAHNIAWLLGNVFEEDVVVMDLDITFGTAGLAFNLETPQNILTALADPDRLDEVLIERFLAEYDERVKLLVAPATLDAQEKMYMDSLDRLLELVRLRSSFVILDVPHRWAPWTQQVLVDADESVVTGGLDLASLRDTKNMIDRLKKLRGETSPVHMVLNHVGQYKKTELSPKDFENALEIKPAMVIPHDPVLFGTASNNGQMLAELSAGHKIVEDMRGFSVVISDRAAPQHRRAGLFKRLLGKK